MINLYKNLYDQTAYLAEDGLRYSFYFSTCRSLMQIAATCALELCWEYGEEEDKQDLSDLAKRLLHPSDGVFYEVLDKSVGILRSQGWRGCLPTWYDIPEILKTEKKQKSLKDIVCNLNKERNDRPAHGVVAQDTIDDGLQWLPDVTLRLINELKDFLPVNSIPLTIITAIGSINIKSINIINGNCIVIRKYSRSGSSWRAQYQILDPYNSSTGFFDILDSSPLISAINYSKNIIKSSIIFVDNIKWNPSYVIPYKQTETFEGRKTEIQELIDWWNDEDSRTCLVFGDGGIGKTTLVLEFLNDLIDSSYDEIKWFPHLIFFYSAKETRWGVNGLEHLAGVVPSIAESIRSLISILDESVGREWMKEDPRPLIDKASRFLSDVGLSRNDILIVLDNTETLARTTSQVDELSKVLRMVATKIGRVLITSRRREKIEAFPVQVTKLEDQIGAVLLKRLGTAYGAQPLISAGESTLKGVSKKLSGKPLLIDVLARYISNSCCGIDQGVRAVLQQGRSDLGEFLFEDAWSRMSVPHQEIFLILGQLGGAVADQMVSWSCAEMGVQLDDWLESFSETKFGNLNDYGADFDINLNPDAREYMIKKYSEFPAKKKIEVDTTVKKIRIKYQQLLRAEGSDVTDRVAYAFRTSAAKAAKIASKRGQIDEAIMWFEEAVTTDPGNGALLDRFAYYLMNKQPDRAFGVAVRACQLGHDDADAHFTAGMIAARMGNLSETNKYLDIASKLGKEPYLCTIQMAKAKIKHAIANDISRNLLLLNDAVVQLNDVKLPKDNSFINNKNLLEIRRLKEQCAALISINKGTTERKEPEVIYISKKDPTKK